MPHAQNTRLGDDLGVGLVPPGGEVVQAALNGSDGFRLFFRVIGVGRLKSVEQNRFVHQRQHEGGGILSTPGGQLAHGAFGFFGQVQRNAPVLSSVRFWTALVRARAPSTAGYGVGAAGGSASLLAALGRRISD